MIKKIIFWCPLLSHVGTINAVLHSAKSIHKYSNSKVYIIDHFGQFESLKDDYPEISFLKIFKFNKIIPQTGLLSKIFIYFISILSIPKFIFLMRALKPDFLVVNLVGIIPLALKPFFNSNCKIINSIQGYPKFNFIRKLFWKIFYKKSDLLITMSNMTKELISKEIKINEDKIVKIYNPVITRKIKFLSKEEIPKKYNDIFKKNFCIVTVGRLTRQKNQFLLIKTFARLSEKFENIYLFIIGEGELRQKFENYIFENNIKNVELLGFKKNPYKFVARSKLFISSSLWEDPGHTLIEASYLNVPILTSNCPSGPKELYKENINSYVYDIKKDEQLYKKIFSILENYQKIKDLRLNSKKISKKFTFYSYYKEIKKFLELK